MKKIVNYLLGQIKGLKKENRKLKNKLKKTKSKPNTPALEKTDEPETIIENDETAKKESIAETSKIAIAYTDGSFNQTNEKSSYGVVVFCNEQKRKESGKIPVLKNEKMSSQSGETYAVIRAADIAEKMKASLLIIYYDCKTVEDWAQKENTGNIRASWYFKHFKAHNNKIEIILKKVKAHSGNKYNDEADELAKKALKK